MFVDGCKSQEEFEDPEPKSHEGGGWAPGRQEGVREEKSGKWWGSGNGKSWRRGKSRGCEKEEGCSGNGKSGREKGLRGRRWLRRGRRLRRRE